MSFMNLRPTALLAAAATLAPSCLAAQSNDRFDTERPLSRSERAEGWHSLSSPSAWRGYRREEFPKKGWVVENGALRHVQRGGGGDIVTRRQYRNFELALEWKVGKGSNSGIIYKVVESEPNTYQSGLEYQIFDDAADKGAQGKSIGAGGLYALYTPKNKKLFPTGEWNRARIVYRGDHVEHWLNGAKIVDVTVGSDDWNTRVKNSKFKNWKKFGTVRRGHIALQDHGNDVWFRNVRIRELEPEAARQGDARMLFDGRTTKGWMHFLKDDGKAADAFAVEKGVLVFRGRPVGLFGTEEMFDNYILELEWRWPEGKEPGNSGVLLRATAEEKIWPNCIEAQLQNGQAGDFWNIGDNAMRTDESRRRGRNTKKSHGNELPIGRWNRYRIICDGSWIRLSVNGEVLNEAWDAVVRKGRIGLQSEGSEIHFRNVRLIPLRAR